LNELVRRKIPLWLESALQIKFSLGLQRGKSDKVDSQRIAEYAYTYRKKCRVWVQPREIIDHLKQLRSLRERLMLVRRQLKAEPREITGYVNKKISSSVVHHCQTSLDAIKKDIEELDRTILDTITGDERLNQLFEWITSVTGVGKVLTTELLIATNEFKNFTNSKKFACHCGIVPFRYTSGTSLKSRARISKRGNKRMKSLLHLVAVSAIRYDNDYKRYYDRRVAQGLHKMSILNVIRNKIVHRVFACVRQERVYIKK
jgi:transposase